MMTRFLLCLVTGLGILLAARSSRTARPSPLFRITFTLLGVAGIASWWITSSDPSRLHMWELYHHYVGAKYFAELRYDGLYSCSVAALEERGHEALQGIDTVRDLSTNELVPIATLLPEARTCRNRFSPATWRSFSGDIVWFGSALPGGWGGVLRDHGFNPSPLWVLVARLVIPDHPVSMEALRMLSLIDVGLLVAMWAFVLWSFPRSGFAIAAVFWGTNGLGSFTWTGGAFLRHDWLFAAVTALAALRRGRWTTAGALAAYATGVRVFPGLLAVGVAIATIGRSERRTTALRFAWSFALTGIALFTVSAATLGADSWRHFYDNLQKHMDTRSGNMVGLPSLLDNIIECRLAGFGKPDGTCAPPERIDESEFKRIRQGLPLVVTLLFLAWLRWASRRITLDEATILTFALLPLATSASSYYYEILFVFGLLSSQKWISLGLLVLGVSLDTVVASVSPPNKIYLVASVLVVQFVVLLPVLFSRSREEANQHPHSSVQ